MKICVIFTGGTIGSALENGYISLSADKRHELTEHYLRTDKDTELETTELFSVLSENMSAPLVSRLAETVCEKEKQNYDGIIVAHGTDTLQYSANAVSACASGRMPIVFVSANYPLGDKRSNGHDNFSAAVKFIKSGLKNGVFISYKNEGENTKIHYAPLVMSHGEGDDKLYSIHKVCAEEIDGKIVSVNPDESFAGMGYTEFAEDNKILVLHSALGVNYRCDLDDIKSVILVPYHSGTVNTEDADLQRLCRTAAERHIPVFLSMARFEDMYLTAREYSAMNIIPVPLPFIAIYMRLWRAISGGYDDLSDVFKTISGKISS